MGMLDEMRKRANRGYCANNCKHLVRVTDTAIGCEISDKLILPEYPPHDETNTCEHYEKGD